MTRALEKPLVYLRAEDGLIYSICWKAPKSSELRVSYICIRCLGAVSYEQARRHSYDLSLSFSRRESLGIMELKYSSGRVATPDYIVHSKQRERALATADLQLLNQIYIILIFAPENLYIQTSPGRRFTA